MAIKVENICVYGLEESVKASKYPMSIDTSKCNSDITKTVKNLGGSDIGSGHDNFLNGIVVQFDLTFSNKAWTEMQRYHFIDFVSSQSTVHCISKLNPYKQCNKYVLESIKDALVELTEIYNENPTPENYLLLLYNIPSGFELTARMTTNYRQLKTIYSQRKNHKLPEWREFCVWIESLPMFKEIVLRETKEHLTP